MNIGLYKWPQGRIVRYAAAGVLLSYVAYAAYEFYAWRSGDLLPWLKIGDRPFALGEVGAVVLALAGCVVTYLVAFANVKVGEYLIAVEAELRKVYWPKMKPWFSRATELWGSTYVVVAVVVILSLFIFGVDQVLAKTVGRIFYNK
jgi:preprotein translocase SecE subunit